MINEAQFEENETAEQSEPVRLPAEIKNLELLDYYAYKLNEIYNFKEFIFFFSSMEKHLINEHRWKSLRNTCVLILYLGLLFCKPAWCIGKEGIEADCTFSTGNKDGRKDYFLVFPYFLDQNNIEIISWFLMLVLILYDLLLMEIESGLILSYCLLFALDILTGFFFLNNMLSIKVNLLFRYVFLLVFTFAHKKVYASHRSYLPEIRLERSKTCHSLRLRRYLFWYAAKRPILWYFNQTRLKKTRSFFTADSILPISVRASSQPTL